MIEVNKKSRRLSAPHQLKLTPDTVLRWMSIFAANIRHSEKELMELDRAIGDADHGVNMRRGMTAVSAMMQDLKPVEVSCQFRAISASLTSSVGGASGPLYGAFFLQASHGPLQKRDVNLNELTLAIEAGHRGVMQLGKANVGDKTMVDTLAAAVQSLKTSCARHESLSEALETCMIATREAAKGTIPLLAKKGRASYLGERSIGFQDPGATSAALLFKSLAQAVPPFSFDFHPNPSA